MYRQLALWFFDVDPKSFTFQVVSGSGHWIRSSCQSLLASPFFWNLVVLHGPFKWNPFSTTFKEQYYLFLKVLPEEIRNFVNFFSGEFVERVRIELTADGKHLSKGEPHFRLNGTRNSNKKCYWWNFINMICTDVFILKWVSESRTTTRIITNSRAPHVRKPHS